MSKAFPTIADAVDAMGGVLKQGPPGAPITEIVIDSRKAGPGKLFFAIRGQSFDGHWFVEEVYRAGGIGAVIEPDIIIFELPLLPPEFAVIQVPSTLVALQKLAAKHRASLAMRTVGITGSNGKTSVKDFLAAIAAAKYRVASTLGNFNNHIGVPLSVLAAEPGTEVGVFEIGMNHAGEIAPLAKIVAPEIGIITNIGVAHIEFLGSREAICEEKCELARVLPEQGTLVYDAEDDFASRIDGSASCKKITIGLEKGDLRATNITPSEEGMKFELARSGETPVPVQLPAYGEHMVRNALLSAAACTVLGMTLEECARGLGTVQTAGGRLRKKVVNGVTIFDDSYNANPDSVSAALKFLAGVAARGKKIAVLGTMAELGPFAEEGHKKAGAACGPAGVSLLIAVGEGARWIAEAGKNAGVKEVLVVETTERAVEELRARVQVGDVMLVKGSRSAKMEKVIDDLTG
jgi:UDP-N-acetylmuramoyl-tripeptide--D-alanyl-D-alanine ligase